MAINVTNVNVNGAPDSNRDKVDDNRICSDPNGGSFHVFGLFPIRKTSVWHFGVVVKFFLFNVVLLVLDIGTDVKTGQNLAEHWSSLVEVDDQLDRPNSQTTMELCHACVA